ncbi:MAG: hypothetical protein QXN56_02850 [Candidatus Hadarchaeum sp.]
MRATNKSKEREIGGPTVLSVFSQEGNKRADRPEISGPTVLSVYLLTITGNHEVSPREKAVTISFRLTAEKITNGGKNAANKRARHRALDLENCVTRF